MLDFSGRAAVSARVAAALCTLCVFVGRATLDPFDPLGALGAPAASVAAWLPSAVAASSAQDCTLPPSNFAVFQGAPFHTDQMGFLIEYFRLCHDNFSIFAGAEHASSALPVFARYYGRLNIRPAEDFLSAHADFAAAFLITPDERALPDALRQAEAARFVYLTHLALNGFVKRWMVLRLYTTPLAGVPATLPVFAAPAPVPADDRRKDVVFVGTIFDGQNVNVRDLVSLASHLAGASFSFVSNPLSPQTLATYAIATAAATRRMIAERSRLDHLPQTLAQTKTAPPAARATGSTLAVVDLLAAPTMGAAGAGPPSPGAEQNGPTWPSRQTQAAAAAAPAAVVAG